MLKLQNGAAYERVSDTRTARDAQGADVTVNSGDVILTGPNGEVATLPARVFDAVFEEVADDEAEESSASSSPETPSGPPDAGSSPSVPEPSQESAPPTAQA